MRITILTVPGCPNVPVVRARLAAALDGRAAGIELVEVSEEGDAAWWGMAGSPTVLIDGIDPFAIPGAPPSVSCRLYRDAEGRADGAPSVQALREALAAGHQPRQADEQDCCEMDPPDPIGRAGRGRRAPAERGLRLVQQAVLRHCATMGRAPDAALLGQDVTVSSTDPVDGQPVTVTYTQGASVTPGLERASLPPPADSSTGRPRTGRPR
ncbi:hypothetical protein [Streptomyces nojiriensis]|uniref:hypothetical protein n=1 Tax=Streptomyces nojiriensis TaxID=66374 RepID=UPI00364A0E5B